MENKVWVTAKGQHILISNMQTSHIYNCINLIKRRSGWRIDYLERLELELVIRSLK